VYNVPRKTNHLIQYSYLKTEQDDILTERLKKIVKEEFESQQH